MTRTSTRRRSATFTAGAAVLLLVAGCAGGSDPGDDSTPTAGPSSPDLTSSPDPTGSPDQTSADASSDDPTQDVPFPADTKADTARASADAALVVTDIRVAARDGYDRVVLDLEGTGTPGWRVAYVGSAVDDGSGQDVEVDGDKILRVRLSGMAMPTGSGAAEYDGGPIDPDGTDVVDEVLYRHWFEGYTTSFVGVEDGADDEPLPFRVFSLTDPARVVVDVRHGADD